MINYNSSLDRMFSAYIDNNNILSGILDIKVVISGRASRSIPDEGYEQVTINSITVNSSTVSEMSVDITSNMLGIRGTYTFTKVGDMYKNSDIDAEIYLTWDDYTVLDGVYSVSAVVRLRCIDVIPLYYVGIDPGDGSDIQYTRGINLASGYNVHVDYNKEISTINIIGGSGLGKGKYNGSSDPSTSHMYKGIRSINGVHTGKNIDIDLSDLLLEHGAKVYIE